MPEFWCSHGGVEKDRSQNIIQAVIGAAGGCLEICGEVIITTEEDNADSAIESLCVSPRVNSRLQLARQLTAMALNCVMSGGDRLCTGMSNEALFNECNYICAGGPGMHSIQECINLVSCWNKGGQLDEYGVCIGLEDSCHNRKLCNPDVGLCFDPLDTPESRRTCVRAIRNYCTILMPGEAECEIGIVSDMLEFCPPYCGDRIIKHSETCDPPGQPGPGPQPGICRDDCTYCGDGIKNNSEKCDDGNGINNDGCKNDCLGGICGDGELDTIHDETCDPPGHPGLGPQPGICRDDCTYCGDGEVNNAEQCDDGNGIDIDECRNDCKWNI
jgi:cysteine-rich repeat protein